MKKIRVLMVVAAFYPYTGGAEKQIQKLASVLRYKNIEVSVITGRWSNHLKKKEEIDSLKIFRNQANVSFFSRRIPVYDKGVFYVDIENKRTAAGKLRVLIRKLSLRLGIYIYQLSLFHLLCKLRNYYDIIHVHQILYPAFVAVVCSKILRKPVIGKVGNSGFNSDIRQIKKFPEGNLQLKYVLKNITRIVCTTSVMKEEFLHEGTKEEKLALIRNGVLVRDFSRQFDNCRNLIFIGRFINNKNIETLLYAFSKLVKDFKKDLMLTLAGDGPEKDNITDLIKDLGIENNVVLTGIVSDTENYLKKTDIFVLPSLAEGLSNSLLEAMSLKLPCIVSNIPGNVEVVGDNQVAGYNKVVGDNLIVGGNQVASNNRFGYKIDEGSFIRTGYGIIFDPLDVEGLVNSFKFLFNNRKIREEIGENSFSRIKSEFDIGIVTQKYIDLYNEVAGK
jgi:glycosyltransferase involved in cell wall biosynthesis